MGREEERGVAAKAYRSRLPASLPPNRQLGGGKVEREWGEGGREEGGG